MIQLVCDQCGSVMNGRSQRIKVEVLLGEPVKSDLCSWRCLSIFAGRH